MYILITLFIFILGLSFGSFINAFQYRQQIGKKNTGRSYCPKCQHQLAWFDLIPLFSWVFLRSKCRYCHKAISWQYPLIELITGLIFIGVGWKTGLIDTASGFLYNTNNFSQIALPLANFVLIATISTCLILLALHDAKTKYVLSALTYFVMAVSVILLTINYTGTFSLDGLFSYFLPYVLSAAIPAGIFFLIYFFSKGSWMGAGDIEIVAMMGLFLGWPNTLTAFYFAFPVGAVCGLIAVYAKKAEMRSEIPFGPFLIAGTFVAYFFGEQLFSLYARMFLGL